MRSRPGRRYILNLTDTIMKLHLGKPLAHSEVIILICLSVLIPTANADDREFWGTETNDLQAGLWFPSGTNAAVISIMPE